MDTAVAATYEDLEAEFKKLWGVSQTTAQKAHRFARQSVFDAWKAGSVLVQIRDRTPQGQWLPWVEAAGLSNSTAQRLLLLGDELEINQLGEFATMEAALTFARGQRRLSSGKGPDEPGPGVERTNQNGGYELTPVPMEPELIPDVPVVDEKETLRMRTEDAEKRANDNELLLQELQDRANVTLARDSDDSRAADIWKETPTATQATERARAEQARLQEKLTKVEKAYQGEKRKNNAVKRDLLKLAQAAELREACNSVLVKHFGTEVVVDDKGVSNENAER